MHTYLNLFLYSRFLLGADSDSTPGSVCVSLCSLKPLDVEFMKAIHSKVNIVPVIAKADTLTLKERDRLKRRVSVLNSPG